jgi:hypothetical protein
MSETPRPPFYRRLYEAWLVITGHFGEVQTHVILFFSYVLAIGPAALFMARKDLLNKKQLDPGATAWNDADSTLPDLERAKRLF